MTYRFVHISETCRTFKDKTDSACKQFEHKRSFSLSMRFRSFRADANKFKTTACITFHSSVHQEENEENELKFINEGKCNLDRFY